ncbi:MAG: Bax inhibitor-1/YccA family protein [Planctomycetia bacterium]
MPPVYALAEGLFLGGVSAGFEAQYPGIVIQAIGGTYGTLFGLRFRLWLSDEHGGKSDTSRSQRNPEAHHDQASPRGPAVDAVVGGSLGVRDPAQAPGCLQAETMPEVPLQARSGREAFSRRRDSKAEADHGSLMRGPRMGGLLCRS